jgi:ABC-type iron transport system FetAB ATPase subunit
MIGCNRCVVANTTCGDRPHTSKTYITPLSGGDKQLLALVAHLQYKILAQTKNPKVDIRLY